MYDVTKFLARFICIVVHIQMAKQFSNLNYGVQTYISTLGTYLYLYITPLSFARNYISTNYQYLLRLCVSVKE